MVRDHRTGLVHPPHEPIEVLGITQNLGRTLIRIKWPTGEESLLLTDDIDRASVMAGAGGHEESVLRQL
ncbi:MAG TPA: hypothetical protein VGG94_04010 [Chthoniobacterales bacterium]|jgi:hypothetical protein